MPHETAFTKEIAGHVAYDAALRLQHPTEGGLRLTAAWEDATPDTQKTWAAIGEAVMTSAGLYVLADDVLAERDAVNAGIVEVGGGKFMRDGRGNLIGLGQIKPQRLLEDEMVRKIMRYAQDLSAQIGRFKGHTFEDVNAFQSLLEQQYQAKAGGAKGNVTFTSFDETMRVEVKIADQIAFGPELQAAKRLVDECLVEWGADSHEAIRSLVNRVFSVEKEGQINRGELFSLLAMEIADERWQRAMEAIRDSIRVIGTKAYLRFRIRPDANANWSTVTIDLAAA
ncbi:DUF3164 family protein [Bosea sp. (in: a-proteobacteria)]|uniref:DUF3164 family protein n=1 Tax=Bosea sp. (in: a-proteobacteria) TaxID=1871050 RepID=UPI0031FEAD0F